jgi:hypothetical protein
MLRKISQLGCEQAQGYFLSKPAAATEFLAWIESYKPIPIAERRSERRAFRAKAWSMVSY